MGHLSGFARRAAARFMPRFANRVVCSACGQSHSEELRIVAGRGLYFCGDCFARAAQQLTPRRPSPDSARCRFCGIHRQRHDVTEVGSVAACADCLGVMEPMFEARASSQAAP